MPANYFHQVLRRLCRNPVLTAMMVFSISFGMVALIAGFAVWRAACGGPGAQRSELPYVVQSNAMNWRPGRLAVSA